MKPLATLFALLLALMLVFPAQAQKIDIGEQSAIVYQTLDQKGGDGSLARMAPGFQNAAGNLTLGTEVWDGCNVAVDIYISSSV